MDAAEEFREWQPENVKISWAKERGSDAHVRVGISFPITVIEFDA